MSVIVNTSSSVHPPPAAVSRGVCALLACLALAGCGGGVDFPLTSLHESAEAVGAHRAYDTTGDGKADFFTFLDRRGVATVLAYDTTGDSLPNVRLDTASVPFDRCRHLVIVLDGFAYDLVKGWYDAGGLRMFHPPSRVVTPYPSMTDLCIADILADAPCTGQEALYFDHQANALGGGVMSYLAGENAPAKRLFQYRAPLHWDAAAFVVGWPVFVAELDGMKDRFDEDLTREVLAYTVGSAGVGTRRGAAGQRDCLRRVEQLVNNVLWQSRGMARVTLLSDHGHSYTFARRIDLEGHLESRGWTLADSLDNGKTAVHIRFGLVTYASFATRLPADLAVDLTDADGVELASYASGRNVVVLGPLGARAVISRKGSSYRYAPVVGDPLGLETILAAVPADTEGFRHADALLAATIAHEYPAPLQRLWRAHFALANKRPDVLVSLEDRFFCGSNGMACFLDIASTHGSLNRTNSVTFIMSTAGALPSVMRSRDIPKNMKALIGAPFPMRK